MRQVDINKVSFEIIDNIARICHEANRALQISINDEVISKSWDETPSNIKSSAYSGIYFVLENENCSPEELHNKWMNDKIIHGWSYGNKKDEIKKTHPCINIYGKLPMTQKLKDNLFRTMVLTLKMLMVI